MGFRVHAEPNPQPIQFIGETAWDNVVVELLGEKYEYHNVWLNTGGNKRLTPEGSQYVLDKLIEAKRKLYELKGLQPPEEKFDYSFESDENYTDNDPILPTRFYNRVVTFLKQTIDNNNYLNGY
jgi:hypothetical protein